MQLVREATNVVGDTEQAILQAFDAAAAFVAGNALEPAQFDRDGRERLIDVVVQVARDARALVRRNRAAPPTTRLAGRAAR